MHIHVLSADGEAKYWLEPGIELSKNYRLSTMDLGKIEKIIRKHEQEIRDAWKRHFGG